MSAPIDTAGSHGGRPRRVERPVLRVALGAAIVVAVLGLLGLLLARRALRERIAETASRELGARVEIDSVAVRPGRLTLYGVAVRRQELEARLDRCELDGSVRAMAGRRPGAITKVRIAGGDLVWHRSRPEPATTDAAVAGGSGAGLAAASAEGPGPSAGEALRVPEADGGGRVLERGSSAPWRWWPRDRWLEPTGGLEAGGLRLLISSTEADDATPLLRDVTLNLHRVSGARVEVDGLGAGDGGEAKWQVAIEPGERRVEAHLELDSLAVEPLARGVDELRELGLSGAGAVSARLDLAGDPERELSGAGILVVEHLTLSTPRLADEPVENVDGALEGSGRWAIADRMLELRPRRLTLGATTLDLDGVVEIDGDYRTDLVAVLSTSPCQQTISSIPRSVLGALGALRLDGTLAGRARLRLDSRRPRQAELDLRLDDGCRFLSPPEGVDGAMFASRFSYEVLGADGAVLKRTSGPGSNGWTPIDEISGFLLHAVLLHEDAGFFEHRGFAPWAIESALQNNLREGRFAFGASTVSMQLARNLFLDRHKTVSRKVRETLWTWWLESVLPKPRILELYLNVIDFGPGVHGVRAAADRYFGRTPAELTPAESAFLAVLLPAPAIYHRELASGGPSAGTRDEIRGLLVRLHDKRRIDDTALAEGLAQLRDLRFRHGDQSPALPPILGGAAPLPLGSPAASAASSSPPATGAPDGLGSNRAMVAPQPPRSGGAS